AGKSSLARSRHRADGPGRSDPPDAMAGAIGNEDITARVHRDAAHPVEAGAGGRAAVPDAVGRAATARKSGDDPANAHLPDAVGAHVADVEVVVSVHHYGHGLYAGARGRAAIPGKVDLARSCDRRDDPVRADSPHAMNVAGLGDEEVARRVEGEMEGGADCRLDSGAAIPAET